jgi:hypothetical protein
MVAKPEVTRGFALEQVASITWRNEEAFFKGLKPAVCSLFTARLNEQAEKAPLRSKATKTVPQGLIALVDLTAFAARL